MGRFLEFLGGAIVIGTLVLLAMTLVPSPDVKSLVAVLPWAFRRLPAAFSSSPSARCSTTLPPYARRQTGKPIFSSNCSSGETQRRRSEACHRPSLFDDQHLERYANGINAVGYLTLEYGAFRIDDRDIEFRFSLSASIG